MTSLEILALILALFTIIKLIIVAISPKKWVGFSKIIFKNKPLVYIVYLALTGLVGYIVLSHLTIVEVGSVMVFVILLFGLSILPYAKKLMVFADDLTIGIFKKSLIPIIIWLALVFWIIYSVLA